MVSLRLITCLFGVCMGASGAHAAFQPPVNEYNGITDLRANTSSPFDPGDHHIMFTAHVAAYNAGCVLAPCSAIAPDGGEGLFVPIYGPACTSGSDDKGSVIFDASGACWHRMNLNGDLRQFGVTSGSTFDCAPTYTCADAAPRLNAAITAAKVAGISTIRGSGMQIQIANGGAPFTLDGICYDGGANIATGSNTDAPGLVWTTGGLTLMNGACLRHVQEQMEYYREHPATDLLSSSAIRAEMINEGATGISCTGGGCSIADSAVSGFDTGIDAVGPQVQLNNLQIDADVGIYRHSTGGSDEWSNIAVKGALTTAGNLEEYFKITDLQSTTDNHCQITIKTLDADGWDPADVTDGAIVWISGLTTADTGTGAVNLNGRWTAKYVSGTSAKKFVLLAGGGDRKADSECTSALNGPSFTDAKYTVGSRYIALSDADNDSGAAMNITPGMTVSAGFPADATVMRYWPGQHVVLMSEAATLAAGPNLSFSGGVFHGGRSNCANDADKSPIGACLFVTAMTRPIASDKSAGGHATGNIGAGIRCGGASDVDDNPRVSSIEITQYHTYGMAKPFDLDNCQHFVANVFGGDSVPGLADPSTWLATIWDASKEVILANGGDGKQSQGVIVHTSNDNDSGDSDKGGVSLVTVHSGAYEVDSGTLQVVNAEPNADFALAVDGIGNLNIDGVMKNLDMYYYGFDSETGYPTLTGGALAQAATDTHAASLDSGSSWWGGHLEPGGRLPTVTGTGTPTILGNDSVGRITLDGSGDGSVTVTFASAWFRPPVCLATDETTVTATAKVSAVDNGDVTFVYTGAGSSHDKVSFSCQGFND